MTDKYFLGSNTKYGFYSYFRNIILPKNGAKLYIIKGGPGSGKSTLLKRLRDTFLKNNDILEEFYCSTDINSLDGLYNKTKNVAFLDATAPHIVNAVYPGAFEILINTQDGFDNKKLGYNFKTIKELSTKIDAAHKRATNLIKSAEILREQVYFIAEKYLNLDVVNTMCDLLPFWRMLNKKGDKKIRLLSAVSSGKIAFLQDSLKDYKLKYLIADNYGPAANALIEKIEQKASSLNLERILSPCSINPNRLEHLLFADKTVCFTCGNMYHKYYQENLQVLDGFYLPFSLEDLNIIEASNKQSTELISLATKQVQKAKILHDELEKIYIKAMDFTIIDTLYNKIINEIG